MSWQRILGHDKVVEAFSRARGRGRLAHAYLFSGPAGVGKRLVAGELAKALLCQGPDANGKLQACDQCPACVLVEAGTHPDFFAVGRPEEANEVPIEAMRDLCRSFSLKSARGKGKLAILDDADDLNDAAANCFLKTLEEPPPGSVFILVGTGPERQLPTIRSRCQVVRFAPLDQEVLENWLQSQGIDDPQQRSRLARLSGGSPGQALALADPELWKFRRRLLEGIARPHVDSVGLSRAWMEFIEEAGKDTASQRRRAALVLRLLIAFLKDALALSVGDCDQSADPDDAPLLSQLSQRLSTETILSLIDRCLEAEFHIDRYVQLVLAIESLVDALGQQTAVPAGSSR